MRNGLKKQISYRMHRLISDVMQDAQCWRDALRIAEDYMPSKLQEIHLEMATNMNSYTAGGGDGGGPESIMARAKAFERGHDYARAIETYLSLTTDTCTNYDALQKVDRAHNFHSVMHSGDCMPVYDICKSE